MSCGGMGQCVHLADEFLLCLRAEVAVDGGLDFEEVLDYLFEVGCHVSVMTKISFQYSQSTVLNGIGAMLVEYEEIQVALFYPALVYVMVT